MEKPESDLLAKIRQQFDFGPYPIYPLDESPKEDLEQLYIYNLVTSYYRRNQRVTTPEGKLILDAGCGTGYTSLMLAEANPGAKIVGIDLSPTSVELAEQRLRFHGFQDAEFRVAGIADLPALGMQFDYINCHEVLYLLPDIATGLQDLKAVLKPDGILRANLHSQHQRAPWFRAQEAFRTMGLMDGNPEELEIDIAVETIQALKERVLIKQTLDRVRSEGEKRNEWVLMNYLFQGDRGYTIPELFTALDAANLAFISMVNWRQWELTELFQNSDDLPAFWAMSLPDLSMQEQLHLFELFQPVHRLIDFWCGYPEAASSPQPLSEWTTEDWQTARVHLHPQMKTEAVKAELIRCLENYQPFEISRFIKLPALTPLVLESMMAACLLPLWEGAQPIEALVQRRQQIRPIDPVSLAPVDAAATFTEVTGLLTQLEPFLYVLVERPA